MKILTVAFCKNCGLVFESRIFSFKQSTNITFTNIKESCPRCGRNANVLEGTFNFDANGNPTLVSGPPLTRNVINAIKGLVEKAKQENFTQKKFIEEVNKISPEAGNYIAKLIPKNFSDIMAILMFVLGILAYIESRQSKPENINNIKVENNYTTKERQSKPVSEDIKKPKPRPHKNKKK